MIELKPCPFCGFKATMLIANGKKTLYAVYCSNRDKCNIHTYGYATEQQAAEVWNRRTYQPDEIEAEFMRLCESQMEHEPILRDVINGAIDYVVNKYNKGETDER